ncbi:hypothetical protein TNCV_1367541 [Trichonephila clavipes]|nr:hypothetical protein TNCV_1367541 [Trichonephila clavipes]
MAKFRTPCTPSTLLWVFSSCNYKFSKRPFVTDHGTAPERQDRVRSRNFDHPPAATPTLFLVFDSFGCYAVTSLSFPFAKYGQDNRWIIVENSYSELSLTNPGLFVARVMYVVKTPCTPSTLLWVFSSCNYKFSKRPFVTDHGTAPERQDRVRSRNFDHPPAATPILFLVFDSFGCYTVTSLSFPFTKYGQDNRWIIVENSYSELSLTNPGLFVGRVMYVKSIEAHRFLTLVRWGSLEIGVPAQMSSSSLDTWADLVTLTYDQVKRIAPDLAPTLRTSLPRQRDNFKQTDLKCIRSSIEQFFSGTRLELMTRRERVCDHDYDRGHYVA